MQVTRIAFLTDSGQHAGTRITCFLLTMRARPLHRQVLEPRPLRHYMVQFKAGSCQSYVNTKLKALHLRFRSVSIISLGFRKLGPRPETLSRQHAGTCILSFLLIMRAPAFYVSYYYAGTSPPSLGFRVASPETLGFSFWYGQFNSDLNTKLKEVLV